MVFLIFESLDVPMHFSVGVKNQPFQKQVCHSQSYWICFGFLTPSVCTAERFLSFVDEKRR